MPNDTFSLDEFTEIHQITPAMKYLMQVQIVDPITRKSEWTSVKGSRSATPYEYDTREEAESVLRMCYGSAVENSNLRIIEKP